MDTYGVYFSRIFLEFFLKPVYPSMAAEKFQIHSVKVTGKYIWGSKNWICSFFVKFPRKPPPLRQFLIIANPDRKKLPISPEQRFF